MTGFSDNDPRYSEHHNKTAVKVKELQQQRCACCGKRFEWNELQAHHLMYADEYGSIKGREIPGVHLIAVCGSVLEPGTCHWQLHQKQFYITNQDKSLNRNTDAAIKWLQNNYRAIVGNQVPAGVGVGAGMGYGYPQPIPDKYYEKDGMMVNAPIAGDLAPGTEPSPRYRRRLDEIADRWERQEGLSSKKDSISIEEILSKIAIPVGVFLIFVLFILMIF